jgi:hypothetical protein
MPRRAVRSVRGSLLPNQPDDDHLQPVHLMSVPFSETAAGSASAPGAPEVGPSDPVSVHWAARLHRELFRDIGPIAQLGERLLRRFSYSVLVRDGLMRATVAEVDGEPAGLTAYTTDSKALHAAATGRYLRLVIGETLLSVLLEPRILTRFPAAFRLLRERQEEPIESGTPVAEIMAFGVLPPYRTPEFVRRTGIHVGDLLLSHALGNIKRAGFREARGVVLADNRPALMFFRMRASRLEPYPNAKRPQYQVWYDLDKVTTS